MVKKNKHIFWTAEIICNNLYLFNDIEEAEYQTQDDQAERTLGTFQVLSFKNFFWLPALNFFILLELSALAQPS